jgi:hypothetical protein
MARRKEGVILFDVQHCVVFRSGGFVSSFLYIGSQEWKDHMEGNMSSGLVR